MSTQYEVNVEDLNFVNDALGEMENVPEPDLTGGLPEGKLELAFRGAFPGTSDSKTRDDVEYSRAYIQLKWEIVGGPASDGKIGHKYSEWYNLNHPDEELQAKMLSAFKGRLRRLGITVDGPDVLAALEDLAEAGAVFDVMAKRGQSQTGTEFTRVFINRRLV